jgi:hypothetical protein
VADRIYKGVEIPEGRGGVETSDIGLVSCEPLIDGLAPKEITFVPLPPRSRPSNSTSR